MSATERTAWELQTQAEGWASGLGSQDPAPAAADLAWQQETTRTVYEDAARLTDQPEGWSQ
ncbi:hypothetical protein ACWF94_40755 [Streptomyces sp. NPDC055078]